MGKWFKDIEKRYLVGICQKCYGYQWMCYRASNMYSWCNNFLIIPTIIANAAVTVLNAEIRDSENIRILTMAISGGSAVMIGLSSFLRLQEKSSFFSSQKSRYNRLQSQIITELITPSGRDPQEVISDVKSQYGNLEENYIYPIPSIISTRYDILAKKNKISAPVACNSGLEKELFIGSDLLNSSSSVSSPIFDVHIPIEDSQETKDKVSTETIVLQDTIQNKDEGFREV